MRDKFSGFVITKVAKISDSLSRATRQRFVSLNEGPETLARHAPIQMREWLKRHLEDLKSMALTMLSSRHFHLKRQTGSCENPQWSDAGQRVARRTINQTDRAERYRHHHAAKTTQWCYLPPNATNILQTLSQSDGWVAPETNPSEPSGGKSVGRYSPWASATCSRLWISIAEPGCQIPFTSWAPITSSDFLRRLGLPSWAINNT